MDQQYSRYVLSRYFFIHFMIKILMCLYTFISQFQSRKLREDSCPKKKKKTFFNTFDVNMVC